LRAARQAGSGRIRSSEGVAPVHDDDRPTRLRTGARSWLKPRLPGSRPVSRFTEGHFGHPLRRRYMLYQPAFRLRGPAPLLVMLHGCGQGAEDFAAGTRMNEAAEDAGVFVLYPEQSVLANALRCWNWYARQDPASGKGDAAIIAGMTRQVIGDHGIDPARVYVAGMSAGGAMAAVLARDYPDLYAALGVHSGVPAGLADNLYSALRLMSKGPSPRQIDAVQNPEDGSGRSVPSIVFHGDEDTTVHPSNAQSIHSAPAGDRDAQESVGSMRASTDSNEGQRGFTRSVDYGPGGISQRELWIVHGAGHAWAGGDEQEKFTDAGGPTASREMLRFFLQHRLGEGALEPAQPAPRPEAAAMTTRGHPEPAPPP